MKISDLVIELVKILMEGDMQVYLGNGKVAIPLERSNIQFIHIHISENVVGDKSIVLESKPNLE